ncbi:hypothetical protein [Streptomyces roseus]|uniref:hypothetical protein n=1 Tax=Streptomyces roseus TaxID=66430 RepID=UPI000A4B55E4|nr:hypothetical protein [Streptomyces roseus]
MLDPAVLKRPTKGQDSEQISTLQQLIKRLEPEIASLTAEIARLAGTAGRLAEYQAEHDRLKPGFDALESQYLAEKDLVTAWNYRLGLKNQRVVNAYKWQWVHAVRPQPGSSSFSVVFIEEDNQPVTWRVEAVGENQDGRPCYWLVVNEFNQDLHVLGNSMSENAQFNTIAREPRNPGAQFQLLSDGEYVRIVNRGSRLALGSPSGYQFAPVVQSAECLKAESGLFRMVRLGMRSGVDKAYFPAKEKMDAVRALLQEARTVKQRVDELQLTLAARQVELKDAQDALARLSNALQGDDDLTVAMPLLAVDATGLSLSGGPARIRPGQRPARPAGQRHGQRRAVLPWGQRAVPRGVLRHRRRPRHPDAGRRRRHARLRRPGPGHLPGRRHHRGERRRRARPLRPDDHRRDRHRDVAVAAAQGRPDDGRARREPRPAGDRGRCRTGDRHDGGTHRGHHRRGAGQGPPPDRRHRLRRGRGRPRRLQDAHAHRGGPRGQAR